MFTFKQVYEFFFPHRDPEMAAEFMDTDDEENAKVFMEWLDEEPNDEDQWEIIKIVRKIRETLQEEYSFFQYQETDTGYYVIRAV